VYGAFQRSVGVVTPVSRAAAIETTLAVEPGSKVEETERAKRSAPSTAAGSLGSTLPESASVRISPVGTSMTTMAQFQNNSYFFGISGLQNYGLLNDPSLPPAIVAAGAWSAASAEAIYNDVVRLFRQLQLQSNGVIDARASMTMALSPTLEAWLDKANQFGLTARKLIASNYPNLTIKTAVQYGQQFGGELIQFICNEVQGNRTAEAAFTEKMRAHAVVVGHSSWSQKKSAGTFGTVIYQPFAIASMTGA